MSGATFVEGLIAKAPQDNAPEYVKAKLSIKREELIAWLTQQDGEWVNAEIKVSQGGKWYVAVDDWKPDPNRGGGSGGTRGGAPQRQRPQQATQQAADDFADDNLDDVPF